MKNNFIRECTVHYDDIIHRNICIRYFYINIFKTIFFIFKKTNITSIIIKVLEVYLFLLILKYLLTNIKLYIRLNKIVSQKINKSYIQKKYEKKYMVFYKYLKLLF